MENESFLGSGHHLHYEEVLNSGRWASGACLALRAIQELNVVEGRLASIISIQAKRSEDRKRCCAKLELPRRCHRPVLRAHYVS